MTRISDSSIPLPYPEQIDRRSMLKLTSVAGLGAVGGLTLTSVACKPKDVSFWSGTIIGALEEIAVLIPGLQCVSGRR